MAQVIFLSHPEFLADIRSSETDRDMSVDAAGKSACDTISQQTDRKCGLIK